MCCLRTFRKLHKEDQWIFFWEHAHYIGEHETPSTAFMLYAIEDYFIEIQLDDIYGSATNIRAFVKGPRLYKYLNKMKLDLNE